MIIKINPLESTIDIFYENYVHVHGFIKLEAENDENVYVIIVQVIAIQTISDYVMTRQKLKNVKMTDYIKAELESELQYVVQGRPIICTIINKKSNQVEHNTFNVFFIVEDLMEKNIIKPHLLKISEDQSDKAHYLEQIFNPDGVFMGTLAAENQVKVYFPYRYLNYHFMIAGATGQGKSNLNQIIIDGALQHNANVLLNHQGIKISILAIDMHDEYALGCNNYGLIDIAEATDNNEELLGDWFYLYPNGSVAPLELNAVSRPCIISYEDILPQDLFATGTFNDLQAGAVYSAYYHFRDKDTNYIDALIKGETEDLPGGHDTRTYDAIRRRLFWLENSRMYQLEGNSTLHEIVNRLENGSIIILNVSLLSSKEHFLFNSVLARTLFEIRKALKSSNDFATFESRLVDTLPSYFLHNYRQFLEANYMKTADQLKRPDEVPIIIFTIEEAPTILSSDVMRLSSVFSDISRMGRKFNLALEVISQQYSPIDDTIIQNMNTVINLPLRSEKEKTTAAKMLGGGISMNDVESLTGTRGIALVSGIWLTNFQKLKIPLYDNYFEGVSKSIFQNFAREMSNRSPPDTELP